MANQLTTEHFPIPVRVENEELNVKVINNLNVVQIENFFSVENTHSNGQPTSAEVNIGGDENRYIIDFICATIFGPNQVSPIVHIILNSGIKFRYSTNNFCEKVCFLVEKNQRVKIYISGHSVGTAGETTSSIYVSGRVL